MGSHGFSSTEMNRASLSLVLAVLVICFPPSPCSFIYMGSEIALGEEQSWGHVNFIFFSIVSPHLAPQAHPVPWVPDGLLSPAPHQVPWVPDGLLAPEAHQAPWISDGLFAPAASHYPSERRGLRP